MEVELILVHKSCEAYSKNLEYFRNNFMVSEQSEIFGQAIRSKLFFEYKTPEDFANCMLFILMNKDIYDHNGGNFNLFIYGCNDLSSSYSQTLRDIGKKYQEIMQLDFDEFERGDSPPMFVIRYSSKSGLFTVDLNYEMFTPPFEGVKSNIFFLSLENMREFLLLQYELRLSTCF